MNSSHPRVALVTGASSGIGRAAALSLAASGMRVYAAARRLDKMKDLAQDKIKPIALDLTVDESIQQAVQQILTAEARIDVLVNNAGYGSYGALEDVPMDEARQQFDVNVFGLARLTQLCLPAMRQQKSGRIINVSSIGGRIGEPHGSWYHATKYAVEGLSDSLRMELRQFGIHVVVIQPGAIKTEWMSITQDHLRKTSGRTAYAQLVQKHLKMLESANKRASDPKVVANAILKAATAKRPKTRYAIGSGATTILLLRKLLTDRQFDALMLRAIG